MWKVAVLLVLACAAQAQLRPDVSSTFSAPTIFSTVAWALNGQTQSIINSWSVDSTLKKELMILDVGVPLKPLMQISDYSGNIPFQYQWLNGSTNCVKKTLTDTFFPPFDWVSGAVHAGASIVMDKLCDVWVLSVTDFTLVLNVLQHDANTPVRLIIQMAKQQSTSIIDFQDNFNPVTPPASSFAVPSFCNPSSVSGDRTHATPVVPARHPVMVVVNRLRDIKAALAVASDHDAAAATGWE